MAAAGSEAFVGIDLAWSYRARTGLAVVSPEGALLHSASVRTDAQIAAELARPEWSVAVVAVDAPLIVTNATGQRECERAVSRAFGRFGASCHPTNLSRPWLNPPRAGVLATQHGWDVDPGCPGSASHPVCLEVYPHPATVVLFGLARIIPYKGKRGRDVEFRRAAFAELLDHLAGLRVLQLQGNNRWHKLVAAARDAQRQVDLDCIEDEVDAILCAHLAWLWRYQRESLVIFGDPADGCIITPGLPQVWPPQGAGVPGRGGARATR